MPTYLSLGVCMLRTRQGLLADTAALASDLKASFTTLITCTLQLVQSKGQSRILIVSQLQSMVAPCSVSCEERNDNASTVLQAMLIQCCRQFYLYCKMLKQCDLELFFGQTAKKTVIASG